ncbi:TPA: hypothetical protein N0F65_008796 [Lagenidium giganteum]|uniref:Uncharacterized protein n=1 Tax=Lagenidium giganteum TaxID=4803 RepID=A0AAV2YWY9_9STRA|nr:TPA: hypothetical protein N0F65_008796 [Lagenidium giganteum]
MSTANVHMPRGRRLPRLSDSEELPVYQPPRRKVYDVYEEDQSERESASASATPEGPEEDDQGYAQGEDEQGNYIIGSWRMGLFRSLGAAVFPNCFMSLVVPCVPLAQAVARIGWLNYWLALLLAMIFGLGWLALEGTAFYHLDSTFESTSYQSYYVDVDISPISTIFARNNFSYGAEAMLVEDVIRNQDNCLMDMVADKVCV